MSDYTIPEIGEVPADFFDAAGKFTSGELSGHLNKIGNATALWHAPIVAASESSQSPGQGPTPALVGSCIVGLVFDTSTDKAYRLFKIPYNYDSDASFHVHWTKSGNASEQGRTVRWRLSYVIFDGLGDEVSDGIAPTVVTVDDVYEDASTNTSRIVYSTAWVDAAGFVPGMYVGLLIDYVDASTNLVGDPVLVSADLVMRLSINK